MEQTCSIDSSHPGPFALYLWKSSKTFESRSVLCEKCAKRVGAWKLPEKQTVEKELPIDSTVTEQ